MKKILAVIVLIVLLSQLSLALSISPAELRIKNTDPNKSYKFIILVSSNEPGLVDVEMKSSEDGISISPNKFMLNEGEKKSIQIGFLGKQISKDADKILIQAYVNNEPSESRMMIYLEEGDVPAEIQNLQVKQEKWWQDSEIQRLMIYILAIILATLILVILFPELKRQLQKISKQRSHKQKTISAQKKKNLLTKRLATIDKRLAKTESILEKLTLKVETFYETTNNWLRKETDDRFRLE